MADLTPQPITTSIPVDTTIPTAPVVPVISNTPYTAPVTPTTAATTLQQYGINPNDVLSASNINQTINAPAPAPDDLLGIRSDIYQKSGVTAAQQASQAAQLAASNAVLGLNQRLTGLSNRAVSMSKITGSQAQERAVSQGEIDALNESARLAANDYAAKKSDADAQFQIRNQEISEKKAIMLQYPGAKISFSDSMDQVQIKLSDYQDQVKKDEWKNTLKAKAIEMGISTKGKNSKELEKAISKANRDALAQTKAEHDLKMEGLNMDIQNTINTIANRNKPATEKYSDQAIANFIIQANAQGSTYGIPADAINLVVGAMTPEEISRIKTYNPSGDFSINP